MSRKSCYFAAKIEILVDVLSTACWEGMGLPMMKPTITTSVVSGLSEGKGAALDPFKALPRNPAQAFHS